MDIRAGCNSFDGHPIDYIAEVACPILIMSGEKDRNTRPADTQKLFERARFAKQLWFVPNAGHVDLHQAAPYEYETRVLAFLAKLPESK